MDTERAPAGGALFAQVAALVGAAVLIGTGAWAFLAPQSFFDTLATFEPYNRHFIHDIGAFELGLGAVLLIAVWVKDSLFVATAGVGIGGLIHGFSHVLDRDLGGKPASDIPLFFGLAILLLVAAAVRARHLN